MCTGSPSAREKRSGCEADHSPVSGAGARICGCAPLLPLYACMTCTGTAVSSATVISVQQLTASRAEPKSARGLLRKGTVVNGYSVWVD